jgi:hypothetical protein
MALAFDFTISVLFLHIGMVGWEGSAPFFHFNGLMVEFMKCILSLNLDRHLA